MFVSLLCVFVGCTLANYTGELLHASHEHSLSAVLTLQLCFVVILSFARARKKLTLDAAHSYAPLGALYALVQILHTSAYTYNVSFPLHAILRSSSLVASFFLGKYAFSRSYNTHQMIGVTLVSFGLFFVLVIDSSSHYCVTCNHALGIVLVIAGALVSTLLGHEQRRIGTHAHASIDEQMVYVYAPAALVSATFAAHNLHTVLQIDPVHTFTSVLSYYACSRGVYALVNREGALTASLVMAIRKFVSIVLSIVYFEHQWTRMHWAACACVLSGSVVYSWKREDKRKIV